MQEINYNITIGTWSVNSADDPITELNELETSFHLASSGDLCRISVYSPPVGQSSQFEGLAAEGAGAAGLGEAAGALGLGESGAESLSVQVRVQEIKADDPMTVELTSGDISDKVITAQVHSIALSFGQTVITGRTGMQKLVKTRLNQIYENQSMSQIINDLSSQAGIDISEIEIGSNYPYYVVHESKNLYQIIRELTMREGMDLYFDTDNKLAVKKFNKSGADHIFRFGLEILDLQLFNHQPTSEHLIAYGESPASNQGTDAWHWIAKDISSFQGEVGDGNKTLAIQDSALRTKDAADTLAASKLGALKDQSLQGRIKIIGNPAVKLADAIQIKNALKPELNGLFKVTSVRHVLNKQEGYLTYIGFSGFGGVEQVGGALGGLF